MYNAIDTQVNAFTSNLKKYKNKQHEKAMKAPINEDRIRKAGW